jgi:murein DD-endopeptidase MepM/ murein hydrolase activator NlpD
MDRSICLYPDRIDCDEVKQWLERTPVRLRPPFDPAAGTKLTFDFGEYFWRCTGPLRLHTGVDIGRCRNKQLLAPAKMIIRRSYYDPGGGGAIFGEIFDDTTPRAVYLRMFHVGERSVSRGQVVETGEPIGRMTCNSGSNSTGLHLHIELLFGRRWPQPWKYAVNIRKLADAEAWKNAIERY